MGIAGLLPQLRSITKRAHVSKYCGQTVAVDAYCLLHRGSYGCARELVEGEPTDRHVAYCMGRIDLLLAAGVRPLVVFDGGRLPNKAEEERARERNREESKARARGLWAQGNKAAALECYQRAVDIQPAHAKQFVEALKRRGVPFIVAPYEADAQMAYLALRGLVDAVLTEDSDLLCYGCPTVFFKMDKGGEGEEVRLADLPAAKELSFQGFGHELFQEMCVLAGCDFAGSLPGIGIKKAHQHLRRTRCFLKVVRALRFDGTKIPEGYERRVQRALWTFKHQRVYCPERRAVVHLHEVAGGDLAAGARVPAAAQLEAGEPDFLGPALPDDVAQGIAVGDLDPITKQPFDDLQPCTAPLAADGVASGSGGAQAAPWLPGLQRGSGRGGRTSSKPSAAAANNGGTITKFLRGLAKPASAADFKAPRASLASLSGSQEGQQEQQQAGAAAAPSGRAQEPARDEEVSSPGPAKPAAAGGDELSSPTEEQWERFRQLRRKGSSRVLPAAAGAAAGAAAAAAAAGGGPTTSAYFTQPAAAAASQPAAAGQGGLLARLRAALQPQEPSVEELLQERAALDAAASGQEEEEEEEAPLSLGKPRRQFSVPYGQQQQQQQEQPVSPLDALNIRRSPTIDDLLGARGASRQADEADEAPPSLGCSPAAEPPPPSQRLFSFRPPVKQQQQPQEEQQQLVDLISPAGLLQQQRQQQEEQQDGGGFTPGFYGFGGSEAGSEARQPTTQRRRFMAPTPASGRLPAASPLEGRQPGSTGGRAGLKPVFDAAEAAGAAGSPTISGGDPIASLSHVTAFQGEAEAAVERAAQAALAATAQVTLQPLPPPAHLRGAAAAAAAAAGEQASGSSGAEQPVAPAAAKRPLAAGQKENRLLAGGAKRAKATAASLGVSKASANPFAGFAL